MVVDEARTAIDELPRAGKIVVMLGALCTTSGKPATTLFKDGHIRSPGP